MGGCVQGAWAPPSLEVIPSVAGWWEEEREEGSLLGTPEEKHLPGPSGVAPLAHPTDRRCPPPPHASASGGCPLLQGCLPGLP